MTERQLDVVSFVADRCGETLHQALQALGYELLLTQWDKWLQTNADGPSRPTILFISDCAYPREEVLAVLQRMSAARILGIFSCDYSDWDEGILRCCSDFLGWPCHPDELALRTQRAFGSAETRSREIDKATILEEFVDLNLLGQSPAFVRALKLIKRFARCDAPVLLEGETGTGKEVAARAIHYLGARRDYPFIPVNCGAIPENLIESELFGHEKGAFTDARERRLGVVAQAKGGTLFLDEVDTLSLKAQISLLRFLEGQEYRPLGSHRASKTDVRIISATNARLENLAQKNLFRKDLLFRLHVLSLQLPPLRERGADLKLLADHFIRRYSDQYKQPLKRLHPDTLDWIMRYPWNGNVRELENLLHRQFLLTDDSVLRIPEKECDAGDSCNGTESISKSTHQGNFKQAKAEAIAAFERSYLCRLMAETGGNISLAARRSGKDRSALRKLLQKHGIDKTNWVTEDSNVESPEKLPGKRRERHLEIDYS